jgi:hypothetical protein
VAGDVVEDIGLGEVIEPVCAADGDGGGELAVPQAIEKSEGWDVSGNRFRFEAG